MKDGIENPSRRKTAQTAGLLYLIYFIIFPISSYLQHKSIVWGDPAATARNIIASERMFRVGFMTDIVATLVFLLMAWALYVLLKPVGRNLALLFLLLNLVGATLECCRSVILFAAVPIVSGGDPLRVFQPDQLHTLALLFASVSGSASIITTLFYGVWLFPLGYLVFKSNFLPRILGILLIADAAALVICFLQKCLLPGREKWTHPLFPIIFIAEFGLTLWLLMGVKDEKKPFAASPSI
jgi:hypothetical protein